MIYNNGPVRRDVDRWGTAGVVGLIFAFLFIIGGLLFFGLSDHRSTASKTPVTSTVGQGAAGGSGKGNVGGTQ
jgi:hypothetical protein